MSLIPPITQQQRWHAADSLVVLASRRHDSRRRRRCRYVVPVRTCTILFLLR